MEAEEAVLVFHVDQVMEPLLAEGPGDSKLRNKVIFANELANLWETQRYMDVDLICAGSEVVRAHKLVLAGLSPFFRQIFLDAEPPGEADLAISLSEVEARHLRACLEKVYLGDASVANIDESLNHLSFTGEALTHPFIRTDALQDVIQATIKTEPGFTDLDEYLQSAVTSASAPAAVSILPTNKKAKVWKHFILKDKETATCKICQIAIRTKNGCTTGLTRHILRAHPDLEEEWVDEAKEEPMDFDDDDPTYTPHSPSLEEMPLKTKKSKVWNFYTRLEKDVAKCTACEMTIKTQKGNTTGMTRHLFRAHLELYTQLEAMREKEHDNSGDSDEDDDFSPFKGLSHQLRKKKAGGAKGSKKKAVTPASKRSKIWQFFDPQDDGTEARCNNCMIMIKTEAGNTSGLVSHLRSSHPEQFEEAGLAKVDPEGGKASSTAIRNSPVWQFYEELGSNRVKCLKCKVILKYYYGTTSGLLRHLRRSHMEAYEAIKNDEHSSSINAGESKDGASEVDNETIWKYFEKEEGGEKAKCLDCHMEISNIHGTLVTSCEEHLRASHTDILEQYESQRKAFVHELIKNDKTAVKRRYTSRVVASAIWSYFRKTDDPALNQCSTCLLEIDCSQNTTAMVRHLEEAHPDQHDSFKKQSGIEAKDIKKPSAIWKHFQTTSDPKKHKCMACEKEILCHYQTTSNMIRHLEHNHSELYEVFLRESHGLEQSEDVNPLLKKPKKRNLNMKGSNDPADRTCPDCGKEYSCRPAMLFHYKCVHSGIRPYKCEECGMTFARQDSWKGHTHSKVRSFLCSICGKTFARRNIRDTHERAHLNDRRYPCSYCGKKFMTNQQRTNHERTHTGEKPFQCTDCGRQFAQQHQLTTHIRIHTGEKPYSCQHCGQKFRHLSSRNNHKCDGKTAAASVVVGGGGANAGQQVAAATSITVSWNN